MTQVAVVIPYFQRSEGLLARAMQSINRQDFEGEVVVIIVDDGSPFSLSSEIIASRPGISVLTRRQENAGPAAARNTALGMVPNGTRFVAFLDSDDEWPPEHLSRAVAALRTGADLYFCDFQRSGEPVSAFQKMQFDISAHGPLEGASGTRLLRGDFFDLVLRLFHIGTSTVVFDFGKFGHVRFPECFRRSHEDTLFWLALATMAKQVAFSDLLVRYSSDGVGIYHHVKWGSQEYLELMRDEVAYANEVRTSYRVLPSQSAFLRAHIVHHRREMASATLHRLGRGLEIGQFWRELVRDPMILFHMPRCAMALIGRKAEQALG